MATSKAICEETDNELSLKMRKVRNMLSKLQIKLPIHCDGFITRCIRLQDGDLQKAVNLIQQLQTTIAELTSWNISIHPSAYQELYTSGFIIPVKTGLNSRVFIVRTRYWDPNKLRFDQIIIVLWMLTQFTQIYFVDTQSTGMEVIWDFSNFTRHQAWAVNHFKLLKVFKWMQNKAAGRFSRLHGIFHPRIVGMLYNGVKPFLKEKIKKRIILHGDSVESLHQYVNATNLPKFLGGSWPSEFNASDDNVDESFFKALLASDELFIDMVKFGFPSQ